MVFTANTKTAPKDDVMILIERGVKAFGSMHKVGLASDKSASHVYRWYHGEYAMSETSYRFLLQKIKIKEQKCTKTKILKRSSPQSC